jgi:predicted nucleic acid-binding Zn ribbon protein
MLPIQKLTTGALAEMIRRQPASKEKTRFVWQMAVGPAIARVTTVELADGVLAVQCGDQRWMSEIARARPLILSRLQQLLGPDAVRRIALASDSTALSAERPTPGAQRPGPY